MYLIREQFFRLGEDFDTTDEQSRPVLHVDAKVLSLRNRGPARPQKARSGPGPAQAGSNATHLPDLDRGARGGRDPQAPLRAVRGPVSPSTFPAQ